MAYTWLTYLGLTHEQADHVLAQSRRAEDNRLVKEAVIARVEDGAAIVERFGWKGERLRDYPVQVR